MLIEKGRGPGLERTRKRLLHVCDILQAKFLITVRSLDADTSIEAPPSVLPQSRYCDITGLEVIGDTSNATEIS